MVFLAVFAALPLVSDPTKLVFLELFTSQGCSSCPPADALLREYQRNGHKGQEIVVLSYHVDYWNYLGWRDPYYNPESSARQRRYAELLNDGVYTPQMFVQGRVPAIGSQRGQTDSAIENATPVLVLNPVVSKEGNQLRIELTHPEVREPDRQLYMAWILPNAANKAERGENHDRMLRHTNVVIKLVKPVRKGGGGGKLVCYRNHPDFLRSSLCKGRSGI